jgi:drug/metabolite transporter (DMT)-like permease
MNKYIIMVLAGACSYGILSTIVKLAYHAGYTTEQLVTGQALTGMLCLWLLFSFSAKKTKHAYPGLSFTAHCKLLIAGASIGLTSYVYYLSVKYIPASVAIVLLMSFTWLGLLLEWLFYGRRPGRKQVWLITGIMAATVLAGGLFSAKGGSLSIKGLVLGLTSALLYAVFIVFNSKLADPVHPLKKGAIMMVGSTLGLLLFTSKALVTSQPDAGLAPWVIALALFGTIIPPLLFGIGMPKIGAASSAILMTAELPVAVISSAIFLKESVVCWQWLGLALMLMLIIRIRKSG